MKTFGCLLLLFAACGVNSVRGDCSKYNDCASCAAGRGWDGQCRWCPKANDGGESHCHDPGSLFDKCSKSEYVTNPMSCPTSPSPSPIVPQTPPDVSTMSFEKLVQEIFDALGVKADAATCAKDVGNGTMHLRNFATDLDAGKDTEAYIELAAALSSFSSSMNDCDVADIKVKLLALAGRLREDVQDVKEIADDLKTLASAVAAKDVQKTASAIQKLQNDWTAVTGGCGGNEACQILDGLLRFFGMIAADFSNDCAEDIKGAITDVRSGFAQFGAKNYTAGVKSIASALEDLADAVNQDACGISGIATTLKSIAPKLEQAIVNETASEVKIIVGFANVYDDLYNAAQDLENGDLVGFGTELGKLLAVLRASNCQTKACDVLEGLIQALQLEAGDYASCAPKIDQSFADLEKGVSELGQKQWIPALASVADGIKTMADSVSACGLTDLAQIVESTATKMGDDAVANAVGDATQVLVDGADVVEDLAQAVADWNAKDWNAFGHDLAGMSAKLNGTHCDKWVCKLTEGVLAQLGLAFEDLVQCEDDIRVAEMNFTSGVTSWRAKEYETALKEFAAGLNTIAGAVNDCGVSEQLAYLAQDANALGIATVAIGEASQIIVHGSDFFEDLYSFVQTMEQHDYRGAGEVMGKILNELSQWTTGHSCTNDFCFVVEGVMEFMGDIEGDIKSCDAELTEMWGNFTLAYHDFTDEHSVVWEFVHDKPKIRKAVGEIGVAFELMSKAVVDCHLEQLGEILAAVATKLGVSPEVEVVEEAIKILVEGVQIEEEIGEACEDYSQSNWIGFGYNIAKLLKMLL